MPNVASQKAAVLTEIGIELGMRLFWPMKAAGIAKTIKNNNIGGSMSLKNIFITDLISHHLSQKK